MRITVDGHAVQREKIVPRAAATHIHGRGTVRTCRHAREALCPADRITLSHRGHQDANPLKARLQASQAYFDAPRVRLHRRLEGVAPSSNLLLRMGKQGGKQDDRE